MEYIGLIAGKSGDSLTEELQKKGYKVALVIGKEKEPGYNIADKLLLTDLTNVEKIYNFFKENNIKKVFIGTGHYLIRDIIKFLENNKIISTIKLKDIDLCKDKIYFKKEIKKYGYLTPNFLVINNKEELFESIKKIKFPIVMKSPIDKVQPEKIDNVERLIEHANEILSLGSQVMLEEFIIGNDCTVAVKSFDGITQDLGVIYYSKAKEYKLKGFTSAKSEKMPLEKEKTILKIANNLVKDLNINGCPRIDFIIDNQGTIYILEMNIVLVSGYTGSAYPFFIKQGINIAKEMVENNLKILNKR